MTPTVARMVTAKERELVFPLRWYSIPNLFRYEKPQKGRLREHWQLNVDIFGIDSNLADIEIVSIAYKIMKNFRAEDSDFEIRINDRNIIKKIYEKFEINDEDSRKISKIIDKKDKISPASFEEALNEILKDKTDSFVKVINSSQKVIEFLGPEDSANITKTIEDLLNVGVKNVVFTPTLVRGFDYYNGIVFEVFDTNPENARSIFGGGRYDNLTQIFGGRDMPAVGFGAGDVTIKDFLLTHNLLPKYIPNTKIYICTTEDSLKDKAIELSSKLRDMGINTAVDYTSKKLGDQIKIADKQKIPFVICLGEDEVKSEVYTIKNLESGEEKKLKLEEISNAVRQ